MWMNEVIVKLVRKDEGSSTEVKGCWQMLKGGEKHEGDEGVTVGFVHFRRHDPAVETAGATCNFPDPDAAFRLPLKAPSETR